MALLSPHHRHEDVTPVPADMQSYLDDVFLAKLPQLKVSHPKLVVVFCAGNAVGKSTLATRIGSELRGLVLENDAVKRAILARQPGMHKDELFPMIWSYTMTLYEQLGSVSPNGLVIRDGVIQWYFDRILPVFTNQGYSLFVIDYQLSQQKQIELIQARGDTPTTTAQRLLDILPDQAIHMKRFREAYTPDFVFTDNTLFDHASAVAAVRHKLESLEA